MDSRDCAKKYFQEGCYSQALEIYTENVAVKPDAVLHSNQALCNLRLGNWDDVIDSCDKAIKLDSCSIKAYFLKGQALIELGKFDPGVICLKTAHTLARDQRRNFGDDITSAIRLAKRKRWACLEKKHCEMQSTVDGLISDLLYEHQKKLLREIRDNPANISTVKSEYEILQVDIKNVFLRFDAEQGREVPDFFCGKISFDIMMDPVVTPSGITYNRRDIEDHLQRVGNFDPITRQELKCEQLIPNLALKEAIDSFISRNEWVEDY
ncbi:E3 ubiquitin-protein ligase CHIP-like [Halichondria panicea]|uniref:E3 ubiquitin-protein ligase CHIP-like n=1 Tax=Halichondria panicea TaxID=6063 RepID=UPI00312B6F61